MIPWIVRKLRKVEASYDLEPARLAYLRKRLNRSDLSPDTICEDAAAVLKANAIVVEQHPSDYVVVACSPWMPSLLALDRMALDLCFRTGSFAGAGADRSVGSDWLFVPVKRHSKVVVAFGLAGRFCRRRFDPKGDPSIRMIADALETTFREVSQRPSSTVHELAQCNASPLS